MTTITLHNTLARRKQPFEPIDLANVRMYVCGPTVYARPHIGNARSVVVYDVLFRFLQQVYGAKAVTYARNITDVDDKINIAAKERGVSIQELTSEVTKQFHDDIDVLGVLRPTIEPKATEHISQIISMIERLIDNGCAYVSEKHVLFSVASCQVASGSEKASASNNQEGEHLRPTSATARAATVRREAACRLNAYKYGDLSHRSQDEMLAGVRIDIASYKQNASDFVLWKPSLEIDDESSKFDSPWGIGRPGWHIECSAMSTEYLGEDFDIHGGGADLMFPHHENEMAQSCCANQGSSYAKYWVHNGFLTVDGEKMSKSLGNFITVHELLEQGVHGEVIRMALMSTHYRKPLDWTNKLVGDAKKQLDTFYRAIESTPQTSEIDDEFIAIIADDLNVPEALAKLHAAPKHNLKAMGSMLGILQQDPNTWFKGDSNAGDDAAIEKLIEARKLAKTNKDWAEADRVRDELKAQNIILEDRPDGSTGWRSG